MTANKREENLSKVGAAITAFGAQQLENQRIMSPKDLAQITPGLEVTPSQNNTPVYTIRGVGFNDSTLAAYPDVSLYIDQFPLPLPIFATLGVFDLQRVEILKGPQGTLFGNNATGGAINFISAKPTNSLSGGGELSYGRFNTVEGSGYVSGPLTDTLSGRVALQVENGGPWQESISRNDQLGRKNDIAARVLLDWKPIDRLRFELNVNGWIDKDDPQAAAADRLNIQNPVGTTGLGGTVPANWPFLSAPVVPEGNDRLANWTTAYRPKANNRFYQLALRTDYDLSDTITLTSLTSYDSLDIAETTDLDGTDLVGTVYANHRAAITSLNQELRLSNGSHGPFRWVVGGNYERTDTGETEDLVSYDATSTPVYGAGIDRNDNFQQMRNYAGFVNGEYDVNPILTLKAGVRQSEADRDSNAAGYTVPGVGPTPNAKYTFTQFFNLVYAAIYGPGVVPTIQEGQSYLLDSRVNPNGTPVDPATYLKAGRYYGELREPSTSWSVGADLKPSDSTLFYVNVKKGYKSGSFPILAASIFTSLEPVRQESLLDYEGGVKTKWLDGLIRLDAGIFYYDYDNKQILTKYVDAIFGEVDKLENVPKSDAKGAELNASIRPMSGLTISGNLTYTDAEVQDYNGVVGQTISALGLHSPIIGSFKGTPLPFAPKWQYAVRADYETRLSESFRGFLGVSVHGQSLSYASLENSAQLQADYAMKGYALVDGDFGIKTSDGRWRVTIWGKNIFNKYYVTDRFAAYETIARYTGRPVDFGVALAYRY